jgi:hypothetical protein
MWVRAAGERRCGAAVLRDATTMGGRDEAWEAGIG